MCSGLECQRTPYFYVYLNVLYACENLRTTDPKLGECNGPKLRVVIANQGIVIIHTAIVRIEKIYMHIHIEIIQFPSKFHV